MTRIMNIALDCVDSFGFTLPFIAFVALFYFGS